ncbi:MAG: glutamate synthase large subunit [Candidatus Omnitrophica bacterium]|nr:glutamate synthase large subunit [Candidatus Omnitrophota bacterium]
MIISETKKQGLYNPATEHDACGVGFVAQIKGKQTHQIILDGIQILENLTHRGATGSDAKTGDGAGLLLQMPDKFLRKECERLRIALPGFGDYGCGIVFLPTVLEARNTIQKWLEQIVREEGQRLLGWRAVPHNPEAIGTVARSLMPDFKQVFIGRGPDTLPEMFDRKLFVIRKRLYTKVRASVLDQRRYYYVCSLSSKTMVYKGQLMAEQLRGFFPDLESPDMESALALVHSRYSTNTFPSWGLAHPFRLIAHNGEINTLRGNVNWMRAREKQFRSPAFGEDIKKISPVVAPDLSDSATFDNALEMLVLSGRSLPHAIMMMIPEAHSGHESMDAAKKAFYEYHSCLLEPWDGPASIAFSDGRYIGAVLDRNGLRPSRFLVTKDDVVVMASETGVLDIPAANVLTKGRLQPGKMFLVDTREGRIIDDAELKKDYASRQPYGEWIKDNVVDLDALPDPEQYPGYEAKTILERQRAFGYTIEDLKVVFHPMVTSGIEATGSMGNDTPLAVLSKRPQLLYNYFKQLFAQVTNPPIDAIREEIVMSEEVMLGAEGNLLAETPEHCRRLRLRRPILTNKDLEKIKQVHRPGLTNAVLPISFPVAAGTQGLAAAMEELFQEADAAIEQGHAILILSDRGVNKDQAPIPALLACAGLHHHLIRKQNRTKVSIVVETGEAREMHHFGVLIGYGANAVNPYLALETIQQEVEKGVYPPGLTYYDALKNYVKSTRKGLLKIISKMGISTIQSYCGAQIFEAVGLNEEFVEQYFTATPSRIGGIGIDTIAREVLLRHEAAFPREEKRQDQMLDVGGDYQWRISGEYHQINPETIAKLHFAVRTKNKAAYDKFAAYLNNRETNLASIRGLLRFKPGKAVPLAEVEPAAEIVKRFATGAMSYGSISKEAHECMAIAMNRLGGFSNTGEGGEDPERFKRDANGDWRRSRIKQVAQGRFGVTIEYLANSDQMQIKMAQGAKPGEGGQLPGHKVSKEIAHTRHTTPGVQLISPPPHHDIYSIEDLAQLIYDLKNANPEADVSVKLVSEVGVGTVAAGVSKGKADHVLISGYEGGTGASPQTSIKHAGLPMELGIAETQQVLVMNDLRGRIRVQADGQIRTGRDVVITAMLGADEFGFATIALISLGCMMLRKCHQNACSVGIATQDPELRKKFKGQPEHLVNYFMFVAEEIREIMASLGFRKFEDMVGRSDMLDAVDAIEHWKAKGFDLTNILHQPDVPEYVARRHTGRQNHGLEKVLDRELIRLCSAAIEKKQPVTLDMPIRNINRTVGTTLSSTIAKKYGLEGLPKDTIQITFRGSAGQSFGAFLSQGVTLNLIGDANDYLGKGLSGGRIVVVPPTGDGVTLVPERNIIVGNVLLYGAVVGEAFIRGIAGERFAVRNSGAAAVVEGVGDHGCEYMTGGRVVVLGPTGRNFAAGMSGGIAYVWDRQGDFKVRCNKEMVELFAVEHKKDCAELHRLITKHFKYTQSTVAKYVLDHWQEELAKFVKIFPADYRKVLETMPELGEIHLDDDADEDALSYSDG